MSNGYAELEVCDQNGEYLWAGVIKNYEITGIMQSKSCMGKDIIDMEWQSSAYGEGTRYRIKVYDPNADYNYSLKYDTYKYGKGGVIPTPKGKAPMAVYINELEYVIKAEDLSFLKAEAPLMPPLEPTEPVSKERLAEILEEAADKLLVDGWIQNSYHRSQNVRATTPDPFKENF